MVDYLFSNTPIGSGKREDARNELFSFGRSSKKTTTPKEKKPVLKTPSEVADKEKWTPPGRRLRETPRRILRSGGSEDEDEPEDGSNQKSASKGAKSKRVTVDKPVKAKVVKVKEEDPTDVKGSKKKNVGKAQPPSKAKAGEKKTIKNETKTTVEIGVRKTTAKRKLVQKTVADEESDEDLEESPLKKAKAVKDSDDEVKASVSSRVPKSKTPVKNKSKSKLLISRKPPNKAKSHRSLLELESKNVEIIQSPNRKPLKKSTVVMTDVRATRSKTTRLGESLNGTEDDKRLVIEVQKLTTEDLTLLTHSKAKRKAPQLHDPVELQTTLPATPLRITQKKSPVASENSADAVNPSVHDSSLDQSLRNVERAVEVDFLKDEQKLEDSRNINSEESETDDDDEFVVETMIEEDDAAYKTLQNSDITQNKVVIAASFTKNFASCIDPRCGRYDEKFPGVSLRLAEASSSTHVGYTVIQPKTIKPLDMLADAECIYWVLKGTVIVRTTGGIYRVTENQQCMFGKTLKKGSCFVTPPNTAFTIENWESKEAMLGFSISQRPK